MANPSAIPAVNEISEDGAVKPAERPFTPESRRTSHRFSSFNNEVFTQLTPSASPSQAKRAIEAHLAETDRRLEEASKLGTSLVQQRKDLAGKLQELEQHKDDDKIDPALKTKLAEIEKEYNDLGRDSARAFLVPKSRGPSYEAPINGTPAEQPRSSSPTKFIGLGTDSPSKPSIPSRKTRNNPATRNHDIEFATEISTSLLHQVKELQVALAEKNELLQQANQEKSQLEYDAQGYTQRLRNLDENEQRYKDENWSLETQTHELLAAAKEAAAREQKLQQNLSVLTAEKSSAQRELDDIKSAHGKLTDDHQAYRKAHDGELATLRRNVDVADSDRDSLQRKVEELTSQNQELAKAVAGQMKVSGDATLGEVGSEPEDLTLDRSDAEHSPPPSPVKMPNRNTVLESETLKSSLHHAHRMIQTLKGNIHREKSEKLELKRLLQESRDEIDVRRAENAGGNRRPKSKHQHDLNNKPSRSGHLGAGRSSFTDIETHDPEWEDHNGEPMPRSVLAGTSDDAFKVSDTSDAYQTANETEDAFETANEREESTENESAFQTGAESLAGDSSDELTETEDGPARTGVPQSHREVSTSTILPRKNSFVSTASTSAGEEEPKEVKTPVQSTFSNLKYRLRMRRGSRRSRQGSEEPENTPRSQKDSPASFMGRGKGQNLAAELGAFGIDSGDESIGTPSGTPSRSASQRSTPARGFRTASPPPPVPRIPMIDSGIMTEPWEPTVQEKIVEVPGPVQEKIVTVPGPIQEKIVEVPGPVQEKIVEVPGPVQEKVVEVPGPERIVEKLVEVPGPVQEKIVEVPGPVQEKIVEVPGPERIVEKILEVPGPVQEKVVEVPGPERIVEKTVEVPGPIQEKIVEVPGPERIVETTVEVPGPIQEKIVEVPGPERIVEKVVEVPGPERIVEKIVEVPGPVQEKIVDREVPGEAQERIVEVPGPERIVEKIVEVPGPERIVEKIVEVAGPVQEKIVEVPGPVQEKIVEKVVEVPGPVQEKIVEVPGPIQEKIVEKIVEVPGPVQEKIVERIVEIPGPVQEKIVEKIVEIPGPVQEKIVEKVVEVPAPVTPRKPTQDSAIQGSPFISNAHSSQDAELERSPSPDSPPKNAAVLLSQLPISQELASAGQTAAPQEPAFPPPPPPANGFSFSDIRSLETEPAIQSTGRAGAAKDTASAGVIGSVLGWAIGKDQSTSPTAGDETTPESQNVPQTPTRKPFQELSSNVRSQNQETTNGFTHRAEKSSQTLLSSDHIDGLLVNTSKPGSAISSPTTSVPRMKEFSRDMAPPAKSLRRPGSSSSVRTAHSDMPPLPPDHRKAIEAATQRTTSKERIEGSMGPPLAPASAYRSATRRPITPSEQVNSPKPTMTPTTPRNRFSSARSARSGRSRRSSVSSFESELDARFNIRADGTPIQGVDSSTDPRMIQAITQTMIGEYLWKYTRKAGRGEMSANRHRRFFWVHPYTRTLYWSDQDPSTAGRAQLKAKSVAIEAIRVVADDNPLPPGLHRKSIVVITPGREIKFTATTGQRHETWFNAMSYLLLRASPDAQTAEDITPEDIAEFNPSSGTFQRGTATSRASLSTYNSRTTTARRSLASSRVESPTKEATPRGPQASTSSRYSNSKHASVASRFSSYWKPGRSTDTPTSDLNRDSAASGSIYDASVVNDSAEDVRQVLQKQDEDSDRLENVRACCDGKHDVSSLNRRSGVMGRLGSASGRQSHAGHTHTH